MRDDVLRTAAFRMLGIGPKPVPTVPAPTVAAPGKLPGLLSRPNFSDALARAAQARAATPYASPMRRTPLPARPMPQRATPPRSTIEVSSTQSAAVRKSTVPDSTIDRPRAAPVPLPETEPRTTAPVTPGALPLGAFPHPNGDNGRGMHWVPTTKQENYVVDRFVAEAQRMGVKWVTFLNNGVATGDNDYLVSKLVGAGIEPVMRLYSPTLQPIQGDVEGMVRHYVDMGVHYFQPFNEPNLNDENPDGKVSIDRYLDSWLPAAKAIMRGGGLPGFGSMAPGGDFDDQQFLTAALDNLKGRGELGTLDKAWLSMHNYTWNHPIEDRGDGDGFFKFRAYNKIVNSALGRSMPIIGTEGGSFVGEQEDKKMAPVTSNMAADWTSQSFKYMRDQREPWMFASSVWTIASVAAGGADARFEAQSLFHADGTESSIVNAMRALA